MARGSGRRDPWEDRLGALRSLAWGVKKRGPVEGFKQGCKINTQGLQKHGEWRKHEETRVTEIGLGAMLTLCERQVSNLQLQSMG